VQIEQHTNYPWDNMVQLRIGVAQPAAFDLALRIPGWSRDFQVHVNGAPMTANLVNGYAHLRRQWSNGDEVTLSLPMPVERMNPHPHIRQDAGTIALQRGPVVYALEEADNGPHLANIAIPADARLNAVMDSNLFGGVSVITGDAVRVEPSNWSSDLYLPQSVTALNRAPMTFKAVPYAFWANREPGEMRVWMREA
jgi:DUF1680 family protein